MKGLFFVKNLIASCKNKKPDAPTGVNTEDLNTINNLNKNGPLITLKPEDIITRKINILGEEPTTKMSIHPEGDLNGKNIKLLSEIQKKSIGTPMMVGHKIEGRAPWGRVYNGVVIPKSQGYGGAILQLAFWFMNDDEGRGIVRKIDGGIWAEGSISYWFKEARCSICHAPFAMTFFGKASKCTHQIGQKDEKTGQICYWYPHKIQEVAETSYVFAGAFRKTKSLLSMDKELLKAEYADDELSAGIELEKYLVDAGLNLNSEDEPLENKENNEESIPPIIQTSAGENAQETTPPDQPAMHGNQKPSNSGNNIEATVTLNDELNTINSAVTPAQLPDSSIKNDNSTVNLPENNSQNLMPVHALNTDHVELTGNLESGKKSENGGIQPEATPLFSKTPQCKLVENIGRRTDIDREEKEQLIVEAMQAAGLPESMYEEALAVGLSSGSEHGLGYWTCRSCRVEKPRASIAEYNQLCSCGADMEITETRTEHKECVLCKEEYYGKESLSGSSVCLECGGELTEYHEYAVKLGSPVGALKPKKSGVKNNEYFKIESFRDMPAGKYFVEPKYDGVWLESHKKDGKVIGMYTDEGNDHSVKFPGIVKELEGLSADNFIIIGEMTCWRGGKRMTHEDVTSWIHEKRESYDDKEFKYKPFDQVMSANEDISGKSLEDRRKILDMEIKYGKQVHPTAKAVVKHKPGDGKLIYAINDRKTREGSMVKDVEGRYSKEDSDMIWKWKRQYSLDSKVTEVEKKTGGGNVYTCSVGRGKDEQVIGDTFATSIEADKGDIIEVSVDYVRYSDDKKKFSWYAPKVVRIRKDKKLAEPLSTVERIAEDWTPKTTENTKLILGEVVPALKSLDIKGELWLVGGIVEKGESENDIDILSRTELPVECRNRIKTKLYEVIEGFSEKYLEFIIDANGPAGPSLLIEFDMNREELAKKWKYGDKFVLQEHGWGKKVHYDLRFGAPKTEKMWGWTCFSKPDNELGGRKTRCLEKKYHDPKWMDVDKKKIKPGEEGNPTKNLDAWMVKIDEGTYEYIRRKPGFLEIVLHGKKYNGRWIWREVELKEKMSARMIAEHKVEGDEVGVKGEKVWLMWKPKEQEVKKPIKKLEYSLKDGVLMYWEGSADDTALEALTEKTLLTLE